MAWTKRTPAGKWRGGYRDAGGREHSRTFERKKDARDWATEQERSVRRGDWVDPKGGRVLVAEWAVIWLSGRSDLKPKTKNDYQSLLASRILPQFGHWRLDHLERVAVQRWVARMTDEGLSPSRIRNAYHVFSSMISEAVRAGLLKVHPFEDLALPRLPKSDARFLSAAEVHRLSDAIDHRYKLLVLVLAYTGVRFGEAAALRRGDLNLLQGRIRISQSVSDVSGHVSFGPTKTHQARTIAVPKFLVRLLHHHLAEAVGTENDALIFTSPEGKPLRNGNFRTRYWAPAVRVAALPETLTIHELRHTCASILISQGVHPKAIQEQLGHSGIEVTMNRYGHLFPDNLDALAGYLDATYEAVAAASLRPRGRKRLAVVG